MDRIQRRVAPRLIVWLSGLDGRHRLGAAVRRLTGRGGVVRLYIAFDDASSAVALSGLVKRLRDRRVQLLVEPVVSRGIAGDPAAAAKRAYAVVDAGRLMRRSQLELSRSSPIDVADTAFLASWAVTLPPGPERTAFCAAAMRALWLESDGPVPRERLEELWRGLTGDEPPKDASPTPLPGERAMKRRRLYDTPAAVVHGQWFFAHERLPQIEHRLDQLGWTPAR
jgi:2-hydroxychromene-2-carboxylate isomerase